MDDEQEDSLVLGVEFPQTMQALGTELGPFGDGVFKVRLDRFMQLATAKVAKKGFDFATLLVHIVNLYHNVDFLGHGPFALMLL